MVYILGYKKTIKFIAKKIPWLGAGGIDQEFLLEQVGISHNFLQKLIGQEYL